MHHQFAYTQQQSHNGQQHNQHYPADRRSDKKGEGGKGKGRQRRAQPNPAKAAKRATFPVINQEVVAAAQSGDLNVLVATIEAHLPKMNLVNLTTALHRLAKLTAHDPASQAILHQHRVLGGIVAGVHAAVARSEAGGATPQCQVLSNIPWSLATLNWVDIGLLAKMAVLAEKQIAEFKTFEMSALLWAYAKLGSVNGEACRCASEVFRLSAVRIVRQAGEFSFRCLVMIAWAFATAGHHDPKVFNAIAPHMRAAAHSAQYQELANTVWSFSTAKVYNEDLYAEVAQRALQHLWDFKGQDFVNLLCGFAASGYFNEALHLNAARVAEYLDLQSQQLVMLLWSFAQVCQQHPAMRGVAHSFFPRCTKCIQTFKPQELARASVAAARTVVGVASPSKAPSPEVSSFLALLQPLLVKCVPELSPLHLAYITASYVKGTQREGRSELMAAVSSQVRMRTLSASSRLLLLRCFPTDSAACTEVVQSFLVMLADSLGQLTQQEHYQLQWTLARISDGKPHTTVAPVAAEVIQQTARSLSSAQQLSTAAVLACIDEVFDEIFASGPLHESSDAEAAEAACTVVHAQVDSADAAAGSASNAASNVPGVSIQEPSRYTVKNTFVELDEPAEDAEEEDDNVVPLPPSLEFIPESVSAETLEAYRRNYQKFRAGKAVGAKGELSVVAGEVQKEDSGELLAEIAQNHAEARAMAAVAARAGGAVSSSLRAPGIPAPAPAWLPTRAPPVGSSTASQSDSFESLSSRLPPPLDCMPRYVDPEKLEMFRIGYQQFRTGQASGAKGEAPSATAWDEPSFDQNDFAPLDPPLSIIPQDISAEELEIYRQGYQRFRAGNAVGAKGEVSSLFPLPQSVHIPSSSSRSSARESRSAAAGAPAAFPANTAAAAAAAAALAAPASMQQPWTVKTKNTFLHIDDSSAALALSQDEGAKASFALPDALEFVCRDISPEKLTAYRMDYQNFRAGNPIGAKGELSTSVVNGEGSPGGEEG
eukprot:CAMPEP_0178381178 /NCGR_PEP_ID=MMETSP0689_2-20121128/5847_1 /TAXON_ID=160604 /ORGANISM="Amphidinium massartii, Strain CS-259" /LENGTH=993 /DNA_ID=CAMNT_0020001349 /DNA_START=24 /DNA_END=3005 /DNA_ORIENTATION=+